MMKWCKKCQMETLHFGNDCTRCHGKHAAKMMLQYAKDHPDEEQKHRQLLAKRLNRWWSKNPELRAKNAVANIMKWNNSQRGKEWSAQHCTEIGRIWGGGAKCFTSVQWHGFGKQMPCSKFCSAFNECKLRLQGEPMLKNFAGLCKESSDVAKGVKKFVKKGNTLYIYHQQRHVYMPWEVWKKLFVHDHPPMEVAKLLDKMNEICGDEMAFELPTFLQDDMPLKISNHEMELHLAELDVGHFVYIKMYVDKDGHLHPLVVGKTGSLLVNLAGNDLNFSMNEMDGPSRKFLLEHGFSWYDEALLAYPCKNEKECFEMEAKLKNSMHLLES